MSQFFVVVRSPIEEGFRLAGAQALRMEPPQAADTLRTWLDEGVEGLVALEASLLNEIERPLLRRLERSENLFYVAIPGLAAEDDITLNMNELVERAVGFSLSFGDAE